MPLNGRNSLGGVINVITKKPDNNPHFGFEQTFGDYEQFGSKIYARVPLVEDKLYFGVSGAFDSRDGYARNKFLGRNIDYRENFSGRTQLRWNRVELQGVGNFYWNDANTLRQGGYGVVNLSSSVKTDNLTFMFWINNLFDKQYNTVCFEHPLHPSSLVEVGAPRTFGVTIRADF
ncbi:MAG: TonB-dependent receptor [Desulfovibrio sp.]|jgi:outer membrane receptor protein involved in Fe transport|nr:TonB-dependent receptor [Desulfovibrio sp.]